MRSNFIHSVSKTKNPGPNVEEEEGSETDDDADDPGEEAYRFASALYDFSCFSHELDQYFIEIRCIFYYLVYFSLS